MTLNEFMKANKMSFADVEEELNKFKTAEMERQKAEKKEQITKNMMTAIVEYAALIGTEIPEEEKELIVEVLCSCFGPELEKLANKTANHIKSARADVVRTPVPKTKTTVTEKDLEDIINILNSL